jgi:hypothetical protein
MCPHHRGHATASTVKVKIQNSRMGRRESGPTCAFITSPEAGPEATIGTLQTRYPRVQASSQDKEQDMLPCAVTCPVASNPVSLLRRAPMLTHVP